MEKREQLLRKLEEHKAEDLVRKYFANAIIGMLSNHASINDTDQMGETFNYGMLVAAARKIAITAYEQDDMLMDDLKERRSKMGKGCVKLPATEEHTLPVINEDSLDGGVGLPISDDCQFCGNGKMKVCADSRYRQCDNNACKKVASIET